MGWLQCEQTERDGIYHGYVERLLEGGHLYPCFCTPEELEAERAHAQVALPSDFESSYASRLAGFAFVANNRSTLVPDWLTTRLADFY